MSTLSYQNTTEPKQLSYADLLIALLVRGVEGEGEVRERISRFEVEGTGWGMARWYWSSSSEPVVLTRRSEFSGEGEEQVVEAVGMSEESSKLKDVKSTSN